MNAPATEAPVTTEPVPKKRAPRRKRTEGLPDVKRNVTSGKVVIVPERPDTTAIELRKAVEAITVRNIGATGDITFLQRKAYNAMLHIAQKNRINNEVAFEAPITEFEELVGHSTSNSRQYLKDVLRSLMSLQVEFDYRGDGKARDVAWGLASMVAEVYLSADGSMVRWSFPMELSKKLLNPDMYNRIDMRMQSRFGSYSALTLYETVSRYRTSETRETFHAHWTDWSMLLSGATKPHSQFRDFNKLLARAVDQVNSVEHRFRIVPHVTKKQRKMDQLWFKLEDLAQATLGLTTSSTIVSEEVISQLRSFGLKDEDITSLAMLYDEEYLLAQADYTTKRIRKTGKGLEPIASPKLFYQSSVENNYANAPRRQPNTSIQSYEEAKPATAAKPDTQHAMIKMRDAWRQSKLIEIREKFIVQSPEKKAEILASVEPDLMKNSVAWGLYLKKGLTRSVEAAVIEVIYQQNCQDPSAEDLLQFALNTGLFSASTPPA